MTGGSQRVDGSDTGGSRTAGGAEAGSDGGGPRGRGEGVREAVNRGREGGGELDRFELGCDHFER